MTEPTPVYHTAADCERTPWVCKACGAYIGYVERDTLVLTGHGMADSEQIPGFVVKFGPHERHAVTCLGCNTVRVWDAVPERVAAVAAISQDNAY